MTRQQINRAIAETVGWRIDSSRGYDIWLPPRGYIQDERSARNGEMVYPPNYTDGLNALKEAVDHLRHLPGTEWYDFIAATKEHFGTLGNCILPDAQELAIVYVKALGKWRD